MNSFGRRCPLKGSERDNEGSCLEAGVGIVVGGALGPSVAIATNDLEQTA